MYLSQDDFENCPEAGKSQFISCAKVIYLVIKRIAKLQLNVQSYKFNNKLPGN